MHGCEPVGVEGLPLEGSKHPCLQVHRDHSSFSSCAFARSLRHCAVACYSILCQNWISDERTSCFIELTVPQAKNEGRKCKSISKYWLESEVHRSTPLNCLMLVNSWKTVAFHARGFDLALTNRRHIVCRTKDTTDHQLLVGVCTDNRWFDKFALFLIHEKKNFDPYSPVWPSGIIWTNSSHLRSTVSISSAQWSLYMPCVTILTRPFSCASCYIFSFGRFVIGLFCLFVCCRLFCAH